MFDNTYIDVPFNYRHHCWFCSEPAGHCFTFPHSTHLVFDCPHEKLTIPSCLECSRAAIKAKVRSIWQVEKSVKIYLIEKYRKDLAIGLNWTQDQLASSGFEGGSFAGFQKSAWFMYQVAKDRVNFRGWPLVLDGIELENEEGEREFCFDGLCYPSIDEAIAHYSLNFDLDLAFFRHVLAKMGPESFARAVRFCRLYVGATPIEKSRALREVN
tara:strand:- start:81 stop:719 length:639 start_codon:yes stop_codon:yes gene_type:complete